MGTQRSVTVWGKHGCTRCEAMKQELAGGEVEFMPIQDVLDGRDPRTVEVMAQLALQDGKFPVVFMEGKFVDPAELLSQQCLPNSDACVVERRVLDKHDSKD